MKSLQFRQGWLIVLLSVFTQFPLSGQVLTDSVIKLPVVEITDSLFIRLTPRTSIPKELLEHHPAADLGEVLRQMPNVSGIRRGGYAVDPVVRGFRYSQVNVHLDNGIHIEGGCPNRMDPTLSHVEPENIQRIEIIRGPYLLQYGPSHGASIRLITKDANPFSGKKIKVVSFTGYDANRNGIRQHLSLAGSGKKFYYRASGGIKDYGNYTDGNGNEWKSSFKKRDASAELGYKLSNSETIGLNYNGSFGRDVLFPALPMDEIADNTHIFSANYAKQYPAHPDDQLLISGYHTRVSHEMDNSFRPQFSQVVAPYTGLMQAFAKVKTSTTGARVSLRHKTGNMTVNGGIDGEYIWKDGTRNTRMIMQMDEQEFVSQKFFNLWKDAFIFNSGLYGGVSSVEGKINYAATLRLDFNHSNSGDSLIIEKENESWFEVKPQSRLLWSLASSASWQINNKLSLSIGLARGSRAPDLQERYIKFLATGYDRYDYLGNPDLKPEINYQADVMLDYKTKSAKIFLNFFRSDVQNFISGTLVPPSVARPVSMGAPGVKQFNNINRAVLAGFETGLSSKLTKNLDLSFSAGYTYAYYPEIEKILIEEGQVSGSVLIKNDPIAEIPAMEALIKTSYSLFNNILQASVELRAVADQNQVSEASYEEATPGYVLANLSVDVKPVSRVLITAGVLNLFDKAYYDHLNRKQLGTSGKLFEPGRTLFINIRITI